VTYHIDYQRTFLDVIVLSPFSGPKSKPNKQPESGTPPVDGTYLAYSSTLKMEAIRSSSERSVDFTELHGVTTQKIVLIMVITYLLPYLL
jgi:CRISPR/Cas system-associated protein Csx1